ncbi:MULTISPECIES: hypothetical protein [Bradyrhizobium]|uniref:hypothetical protein n=1 Tax=Bradyrhizobium TaxID=374 RepID=UPI001EDBA675|nr:hypothetical protein [Bradyrhizobium zhengyangense]MCG2641430.1 hypothetical protein [Bradyrhizobium zhengyangense]
MTHVNVSIPLRTTNENGFFIHREAAQRQLLGYVVQMRIEEPYAYLELQGIPAQLAAELLDRIRAIVPWAALRLDFGILAAGGDLRVADGPKFDGQFATAYPAHLAPAPMRIGSNHRTEEADARLFSALIEGAELECLTGPSPQPELKLACEIFASVDFEASNNAQFLALISILEIMARPAPRPKPCLDIIEDAMVRMKSEAETAMDPALRQALLDMHTGAVHWKSESIRSSVRRLAIDAARTLGDPDSGAVGKSAVRLYDKRSLVVHQGETASLSEARFARQLVREVLAVAAGSYEHIRERFPTN